MVIEITSPSTRKEDLKHKFALYRDTLRCASTSSSTLTANTSIPP